jgi:hypothetical protein
MAGTKERAAIFLRNLQSLSFKEWVPPEARTAKPLRGCLESPQFANRRTINRIIAIRIMASLLSIRVS